MNAIVASTSQAALAVNFPGRVLVPVATLTDLSTSAAHEKLFRGAITENLSRPGSQFVLHPEQMFRTANAAIGSLREIVAKQPVGLFVCGALRKVSTNLRIHTGYAKPHTS